MHTMTPEQTRYEAARKRVRELKNVYVHLVIYLTVNLFMFVADVLTGDGWWFYWLLFAWGIGIAAHGLSVFVETEWFGQRWEERKIREMMDSVER